MKQSVGLSVVRQVRTVGGSVNRAVARSDSQSGGRPHRRAGGFFQLEQMFTVNLSQSVVVDGTING